jgi:hypothetical protein
MFSSEKAGKAFYSRGGNSSADGLVTGSAALSGSSAGDDGKSSYYVWFLGSRESKGLRGAEYIRPAVRHMLDYKTESCCKMTLQVSSKGIKMVQTPEKAVSSKKRMLSSSSSSSDVIKQFVPHSSITCVTQGDLPNDDVVSCILLVNNNSSDCPLYVHSYRCDSAETAEHLKGQIQAIVDKPENTAKFDDIEQRLVEKGLLLPVGGANNRVSKFPRGGGGGSNASSKIGSDGRSIGRSSDSGGSELSPSGPTDKLVTLYDSLAAELREKLNGGKGKVHPPLLLPPRDYDTMHRGKGNLTGVEKRRALNPAIVGDEVKNKNDGVANSSQDVTSASSEGEQSSGIGSDDVPTHIIRDSPANLLAASGDGNGEKFSSGKSCKSTTMCDSPFFL